MNNNQDKPPNEALDVPARQLTGRDALRWCRGASPAAARGIVAGLFLFLMLVVSSPTTVAQDAALKQRLDAVIDRAVKEEKIVGLTMLVAQRYGIKGIPTLILFRQGTEAERVVGAVSKDALSRMIEKHCGASV
ncbi:MAG: hypothetical protein H0T45_18110 [Pyrinomonadaceae bacterium]|nr:hypothetical protein [Pyrinomonadaceae bacterium]